MQEAKILPAKKRTIKFSNGKTYYLPFPKLKFILDKDVLGESTLKVICVGKGQFSLIPLANCNIWGCICLGKKGCPDNIDDAIAAFWNTKFNYCQRNFGYNVWVGDDCYEINSIKAMQKFLDLWASWDEYPIDKILVT